MANRPNKRSRKASTHDRLQDDNDIEIIHSRHSTQSVRDKTLDTGRSPQKGRTSWREPLSWVDVNVPEDHQTGLMDDGWIDEGVSTNQGEEILAAKANQAKLGVAAQTKRRSLAAVSILSSL